MRQILSEEAKTTFEMSVQRAFEAQLYFLVLILRSKTVCRKKLNVIQNVMNSLPAEVRVQHVQISWDMFSISYFLGSLQAPMKP